MSRNFLSKGNSFLIKNVNYHGKKRTYEISKDFSPQMTLDGLAEFSSREKEKGNFYAVGLPQFLSIALKGFKDKNNDFLKHIHSGTLNNFSRFLSKTIFNIRPMEDEVIHEYGMPEQYSVTQNIYEKDEYSTDFSSNSGPIKAVTEVKNLDNLIDFSQNYFNANLHFLTNVEFDCCKKLRFKTDGAVCLWYDDGDTSLYIHTYGEPSVKSNSFLVRER